MNTPATVTVNDRQYTWPSAPTVVVCVDGSEPAYMDQAIESGHMPFLAERRDKLTWLNAQCAMPSYTNPNNMSIVTGHPTAVHGIAGNTYLDVESGEEILMNDPAFLRAETIFEGFHAAGAKVAVVTAKDKLRRLLAKGLDFTTGRAWCFSSQKAADTTVQEHGIDNVSDWLGMPVPDVYSAELSSFIFAAGAKLLREHRPDVMYLSTTDYIQHKFAPGTDTANAFYKMLDDAFTEMDQLGANVVITADHGMKPKHDSDGSPNVVYLQSELDEAFGSGETKVVLPITDPYPVHHGALGSYATVYLHGNLELAKVVDHVGSIPGIAQALSGDVAAQEYSMPRDRMGEIAVIGTENMTIGTTPERHDLSGLTVPLRSHGGLTERDVPLIASRPLSSFPQQDTYHNYDAFALALNSSFIAG